ncbi:hypothetical protein T11_9298 [Trichinella zimbabwensis]|uniref:Uncharacterized protein n=1 Tax=Trichinella zimbabwensis TaxID=268475 RepID=A0A0V1HH25_9BILA|nr:hypothetical protein T11_9298 [Trichinella zimbabwensis]
MSIRISSLVHLRSSCDVDITLTHFRSKSPVVKSFIRTAHRKIHLCRHHRSMAVLLLCLWTFDSAAFHFTR